VVVAHLVEETPSHRGRLPIAGHDLLAAVEDDVTNAVHDVVGHDRRRRLVVVAIERPGQGLDVIDW
jgi:hypothetical protein